MEHIEVRRIIPAPREKVWARYTDHRSWSRWAGLGPGQVTLRPEGAPTPDGVGCVRVFSAAGRDLVAEEVTLFDAPARMKYRIVRGGGPVKDHEAEVLFTEEGAGTIVTWRCRFGGAFPGAGPVVRIALTLLFGRVLRRLAADLAARQS